MKIPFFALILLLLSFGIPTVTQAQQEPKPKALAPVSGTYAITNATIIQSPGRIISNGNIVLKNGIIAAVGKNVTVPPDAIIHKGDSLYVYAGFIDGLSHAGVIKPREETNRERPKDPGNPTDEAAGISPQKDVRDLLNPADKSVDDLRELGFTTAHVVPYGGMLPGAGAIVLLHGTTADNMLVVRKSSLFSQLTGAPRVYPATIIGVMAKWRELYRQSLQSKSYEALYASNRNGLSRPAADRIREAFYPVIDKQVPVLFEADKFLKLNRILSLQAELGFPLIVGDLKEGWEAISELKSSGTKVFLSLDLPEKKPNETEKAKKELETENTSQITPQERAALEKRKSEFTALYVAQASAFQKEGVVFGFSSLTAKPKDIKENLRRMIAAGLTEEQALAALTTSAAKLLQLNDRMGTVEQGKIANLVVTDKPYFHEKSSVRYVFVEGNLYQYQPAVAPKTESIVTANLVGTWTVVIETPEGKQEEKLTVRQEGNNFSGSVTGEEMTEAAILESIVLNENRLSYSYTVQAGGQSYKVDVQATVEGNAFKGTSTRGTLGNFPIEAKKDPHY